MSPPNADTILRKIADALRSDAPLPSPLRHATLRSNLPSILSQGLDPGRWSTVHGGMDVHVPVPCVYLSSAEQSNNLHTSLFDNGPSAVVVLDVDASGLDTEAFHPDDALYALWERGDIFEDADEMADELGIDSDLAESYLALLEQASDEDIPILMKPLWRWHLEREGEVAYAACIPPSAVTNVRVYGEESVVLPSP